MAPGGLVEVRVSWPGHPRYLKKKKIHNGFLKLPKCTQIVIISLWYFSIIGYHFDG